MASPDFLVIPHQLILDERLRPLDRIVYGVVYWYAKMKEGRCFASNATIAANCGPDTAPRSVKDSLSRLAEAGHISRVMSDDRTARLEIVPLVTFGGVASNEARGGVKRSQGVASTAPQSSNSSNRTSNQDAAGAEEAKDPGEEKAIGEVIKAFEPFTPEAKNFYNRKPQREAARALVRDQKIGLSRVKLAMATLYEHREDRYAPLVDSPLDLSAKWAKVYRYVKPKLSNRDD